MASALIISATEKSTAFLSEVLSQNFYKEVVCAASCARARRFVSERDFALCVVNCPLPDEFGDQLAQQIAEDGGAQVLLIVGAALAGEISARVASTGILVIAKPLNRSMLIGALSLAGAAYKRLSEMQSQNKRLVQKIEDIRIVDRAKCILIEYLKMTENEAHKHIERQAMDLRMTKRAIAERILKTYED